MCVSLFVYEVENKREGEEETVFNVTLNVPPKENRNPHSFIEYLVCNVL